MDVLNVNSIISSLIYSGIGVIVLLFTFYFLDIITPHYNLWKEIIEKQNLALAILLGAAGMGIAIIIAAAIHA
jgi:uncharacterized membrane protein YjfL (UPF0719 family)